MILDFVTNKLFKKLLDGVLPAGDSKKLGGKGASEYVSVDDYKGGSTASVGVAENGNLDLIAFMFSDGTRKILKWDNETKRLVFSGFDGSTWSGNDIAYTADLAKYLPLRGGTVDGTVTIRGTDGSSVKVDNVGGGDYSYIDFLVNGVRQGLIGIQGGIPRYLSPIGSSHALIHDANIDQYAVRPRGLINLDLDTVKWNGTQYISTNATNTPNGAVYGQMLSMRNEDTTAQLYISHANNIQGLAFRGASDNAGFYPWRVVVDSYNVGNYATGSAYGLLGYYSPDNGGILYNPNYGGVRYAYNVTSDTAGIFPTITQANSVLTLNRHAGDYTSQLGFSSNGCLYYRTFDGEAMYASKAWREILHTGTSAKVVIKSTAPTDTSALWVW